eukprot:10526847-Lingulodinium_polyedra.AAC.1
MAVRNFPSPSPPTAAGGEAQAPGAQPARRSAPSQGVSFLPFGDLANVHVPAAGGAPGGSSGVAYADASGQQQRAAQNDPRQKVNQLQLLLDQATTAGAQQQVIDLLTKQLEEAKDQAHAAQP